MNAKFARNGIVMLVLIVGTLALLWTWLEQLHPSQLDRLLQVPERRPERARRPRSSSSSSTLTVTKADGTTYTVTVPTVLTPVFADMQAAAKVGNQNLPSDVFGAKEAPDTSWLGILITGLLPLIVIVGFILFMMRQAQGTNNQALSFGKSRARMFLGNKTVVTFGDVAGVDEAKTELQEVVEFLKYPEKFNSLGARIPRGVLLVGPPGTGKTLMARAVAGEAGVPFFSISGSEFVEMFVGVGASRVRDLFDQAKRNSPCIVFVDEIDAVGRQRGAGLGGSPRRARADPQPDPRRDGRLRHEHERHRRGRDQPARTSSTRRSCGPAGSTARSSSTGPTCAAGRRSSKVHTKGKPLDKSSTSRAWPSSRPGFSGADLANLVNEAAILSARRNKKVIGMSEFQEALERIVAGPERQQPGHQRRREEDHRLPRGRPRRRDARPAEVRPGPEGHDHQPRHGPRLHDGPAHRGSLPEEQDRVRGRDRRACSAATPRSG